MAIPSAPSLDGNSVVETITIDPAHIFESYGLSEEEGRLNAPYARGYSYGAIPFHKPTFKDSAFIVESGVVFDPATKLVNEKTVYQTLARESNVVLDEASGHYLVNNWWERLVADGGWRKLKFDAPVIANWHRYCNVHTHFLVEFLFSAWKLMSDRDQAWRWPMVVNNRISAYQWDALHALDIHQNVITLPGNSVVTGDFIVPSALHAKTWVHPEVSAFGNYCREKFSSLNPSAPEKIYISRASASARRMVNEKELEAALSEAGFTIMTLEGRSFQEQVALFSRAKVVVGPHGSGLANVIFAPAGCSVMELTAFGFLDRWPLLDGSFRRLAYLAGHSYSLITFGNERSSPTWKVDVDAVLKAAKSLG